MLAAPAREPVTHFESDLGLPTPSNDGRRAGCLSCALNPGYAEVAFSRELHQQMGRGLPSEPSLYTQHGAQGLNSPSADVGHRLAVSDRLISDLPHRLICPAMWRIRSMAKEPA